MKKIVIKRAAAALAVCCTLGCICVSGQTVQASEVENTEQAEMESTGVESTRTLEEVQAEMDAALEIQPVYFKSRAAMTEPTAEIGKTAKWLDIERGYAQIDLTEADTSVYSNQAVDYLIILDRTRTMSLNDKTFEGSPSSDIGSGNSPCLNRNHYYEINGKKLDLYDYENGIVRGTNEVVTLPLGISPYKYHKDASGNTISVDYSNGCTDRLTIAKDTICGLIDRIAGHAGETGNVKSRVSYWSFAGTYWPAKEGDLDTDLEKGLFNYIGLTSQYTSVKTNVRATGTYAGTYYLESLKRAWEQLSSRTGAYKDMPSKVIFISDGKCADDESDVTYWASQLKAIPNCTVYTLAVGMPLSSDGAVLLKNMSTNQNSTTFAAFTTNLNSSNPAFADTLTAIEEAAVEVKAVDKVLTDKIDTRYWEFVEVLSADGTAAVNDNVLTWEIPEGAGKTYTCSLKVRLKDEYRFLLSDTSYPTNLDTEEEKGCSMKYIISGGIFHGEGRTVEKETPWLKYGTLQVKGTKYFTIDGSKAEQVALTLMRKIDTTEQKLAEMTISDSKGWAYSFAERTEGDEIFPLVRYTNEQKAWTYYLEESADFYKKIDEKTTEQSDVLQIDIYNEPYKIKVQMEKKDAETKVNLSGAVFGVYTYSRSQENYVPYCGQDKTMTGTEQMLLKENDKGIYISERWLYYTPDNEGKFRIIEEQAPEGYLGDFTGTESDKKRVYDIRITEDNTGTTVTEDIDGEQLCAYNQRIKGKLKVYKKDADSLLPVPQGTAALFYEDEAKNARYGLFAAEDICHPDGVTAGENKPTGILWEKDELAAEARINGDGFLVFEDLDLGSYYVKELDTPPEGYLLNSQPFYVSMDAADADSAVVIQQLDVLEPVKKQALRIYKVAESSSEDEMDWLLDAGFMVFPVSSLGDAVQGMPDEEILDYVDENYRNRKILTYEPMKELKAVTLYENGQAYELGEVTSEDGVYEIPPLPYGDYIIAETKVPDKKRPVRPFIIHIREDETDRDWTGDCEGTPLQARVLRDKEVLSRVRIIKVDAETKKPLTKGTAGYVIHDVEGTWKETYLKKATLLEKARYLLKYNGLVVEYDAVTGIYRGTYENPFMAEPIQMNEKTVLAAATSEGLPTGVYELEEVKAPEGYILQGEEGVIARGDNGTFYETAENGKWEDTPSEPVRFSIGSEYGYYDAESDCWWTEVQQANMSAIGKISALVQQEIYVKDDNGKNTGKTQWIPVENAELLLTAAENIYAQNGDLLYKKGEEILRMKTDAEGQAWTGTSDDEYGNPQGLYPGCYELTWILEDPDTLEENYGDVKKLDGWNEELGGITRLIKISYEDEKTPVIYKDEVFRLPVKTAAVKSISASDPENNAVVTTAIPVTGDDTNLTALLLMAASAAVIAGVCVYKRKYRR